MKAIRRLGADAPVDTYRKALRGSLRRMPLTEDEFRELQQTRPECIVVDDDAVLVAEPRPGRVDLHYAFPDQASFVLRFPPMLDRAAALFTPGDAAFGMFLRLTDRALRGYVEPVLFENAFEVKREWLRMELSELPDEGSMDEAIAPGFRLRAARPDDAEAIVELDIAAFPSPSATTDTAASDIRSDPFWVLEDESTGRAIGFLHLHTRLAPAGYISDIALHPDYQRRGLGEALMRWSLVWFREQGLRRAALTTNADNARAIALYRKLGFTVAEIGVDYRRPIDEDEVRQVQEKRRAEHITVRRAFS
jgi:ribosomal protein S18 acetylase RimI-like enzyme